MMTPVLQCRVAYNRYGGYCVPQSSSHRPAARTVLSGDVWEPDTIEFMAHHAGNGDIVHAGTYFGDFIPALSRACLDGARLWAFEPNPENYRCALITIVINDLKNVAIKNAGLGAQNGPLLLRVSDENGRALGGISRFVLEGDKNDREHFVEADVVRLDDVLPADRRITILQLDVEGFEQQALTGAMKTIQRCKPILILEGLPAKGWFSENVTDLGYEVCHRSNGNTILAVSLAALRRGTLTTKIRRASPMSHRKPSSVGGP